MSLFPNLPEALRVRRFRWPLIVLLGSIGLTAFAAFQAQRMARSQRDTADRALREYANFAVWSYAQHLLVALNAVQREAVGAVNHGDALHTGPHVPLARDLAHYLPWDSACACHRPRVGPSPQAYFAVNVRKHEMNVGINTHDHPEIGWEVDRPMATHMDMTMASTSPERSYTPAEQAWLLDSLTTRVRSERPLDRGFTFVVDQSVATPRIFTYTVMPTSWGDTLIYGARYSKADFVRILSNVLDENGVLPETFTEGRRNRDVLAVSVRDSDGRALFTSDSTIEFPRGAHIDLSDRVGSLRIDATIRPEMAGQLLIGGLPRSRLPFLLGLLGLAAALSIVAVAQLRREGELAQLRGNFVSSVSHELRTPVAQIRLYLETLQLGRANTDDQRRWALGHIERETTRLTHLVENVLRFSTLGRPDGSAAAPIDPAGEVRTIVEEFAPLAASRHATIVVDSKPTSPIAARPDALRHILINLLDNAVKYGPTNQTIRVSVAPAAENVEIAVEDEGPGIAANEREAIWRPFARGDFTADKGGSGIGLTIVREVAEGHGGTVRIESGRAGGARFVVALPEYVPAGAA